MNQSAEFKKISKKRVRRIENSLNSRGHILLKIAESDTHKLIIERQIDILIAEFEKEFSIQKNERKYFYSVISRWVEKSSQRLVTANSKPTSFYEENEEWINKRKKKRNKPVRKINQTSNSSFDWFDHAYIQYQIENLDWANNDFSLEKMYIMSMFSELAYCEITEIDVKAKNYRRATVVPSYAFQELIQKYQTQFPEIIRNLELAQFRIVTNSIYIATIIKFSEVTFVALRGTSKTADWIINLDAKSASYREGKLHGGFFKEASKNLEELVKCKELQAGHIYITGHSLGGALAVILENICQEKIGGSIVSTYTFGAPRTGNIENSKGWNDQYSCIRRGDPVPNFPPKILGYKDPVFLCDPAGKTINFERVMSVKLFELSTKKPRFGFTPDHSMERYLRDIAHNL